MFFPYPKGSQGALAGNSAEAQQFFDRLGTPPSGALESAYNDFIDGLVAAGIWDALDGVWLFPVPTQADSLVNLIAASPTLALYTHAGNPDVFTADSGWKNTGGLSCLKSSFNPTTFPSPKFTRDSACAFYWSGETTQINQSSIASLVGDTGFTLDYNVSLFPKWSNGLGSCQVNSATATIGPPSDSAYMFLINRTASNAQAWYRNTTEVAASSAASAALVSAKIILRSNWRMRAFGFGRALVSQERSDLQSLLSAFVTARVGSTP